MLPALWNVMYAARVPLTLAALPQSGPESSPGAKCPRCRLRFARPRARPLRRRHRLVRFGGWDGQQRTSDTWELRDSEWVRFQDEGPSPRNHAVLVSARDRGSVILYGGHDGEMVLGDLWERRNGRLGTHPIGHAGPVRAQRSLSAELRHYFATWHPPAAPTRGAGDEDADAVAIGRDHLAAAGAVSFVAAFLLPMSAPHRLTKEFEAAGFR
jgi:hypothetical protein